MDEALLSTLMHKISIALSAFLQEKRFPCRKSRIKILMIFLSTWFFSNIKITIVLPLQARRQSSGCTSLNPLGLSSCSAVIGTSLFFSVLGSTTSRFQRKSTQVSKFSSFSTLTALNYKSPSIDHNAYILFSTRPLQALKSEKRGPERTMKLSDPETLHLLLLARRNEL